MRYLSNLIYQIVQIVMSNYPEPI